MVVRISFSRKPQFYSTYFGAKSGGKFSLYRAVLSGPGPRGFSLRSLKDDTIDILNTTGTLNVSEFMAEILSVTMR